MAGKTLVLGGYGLSGTAWQIGLLKGFLDRGLDLTRADVILATSSGALTAALITSGRSIDELYAEQMTIPPDAVREPFGIASMSRTVWYGFTPGDDRAKRIAIARAAVRSRRGSDVLVGHWSGLPDAWPDRDIRVTAVRADTGELRVFTRRDQVPLATAVAASGALPFVRRPVEVDGVWYVDGSIRSMTNADLATGASHVVVLAPVRNSRGRGHGIAIQLRGLGPEVGAAAVAPDRRTLRTVGERHFDPRRCPRAARAGYLQAPRMLSGVVQAWRGGRA